MYQIVLLCLLVASTGWSQSHGYLSYTVRKTTMPLEEGTLQSAQSLLILPWSFFIQKISIVKEHAVQKSTLFEAKCVTNIQSIAQDIQRAQEYYYQNESPGGHTAFRGSKISHT